MSFSMEGAKSRSLIDWSPCRLTFSALAHVVLRILPAPPADTTQHPLCLIQDFRQKESE